MEINNFEEIKFTPSQLKELTDEIKGLKEENEALRETKGLLIKETSNSYSLFGGTVLFKRYSGTNDISKKIADLENETLRLIELVERENKIKESLKAEINENKNRNLLDRVLNKWKK